MANLVNRARELSKLAKDFTTHKVVPVSKQIVSTVKPRVVNGSRLVVRVTGPVVRRSTDYVLNQPLVKRTTKQIQSTVAALQQKTRDLIEGPDQTLTDDGYREHFIPITRRSMIRRLMQKEDGLTAEERRNFEEFAMALDAAIVNKYHGSLQELKTMFDPINPDKDTMETRKMNPRERQDNEFWLLQRLDEVMVKANFFEIPVDDVKHALQEREGGDGVLISVDQSKYDVLKFWALGRERIPHTLPWYRAMFKRQEELPEPLIYFKRVVVACRLKRDQKLVIKSFKDMSSNTLAMMLPDGKLRQPKQENVLLVGSGLTAVAGIAGKVALDLDWCLLATGVFGAVTILGLNVQMDRKNKYRTELSRVLYFKNVANNRGLLALLVDRAEDESFKEALLVYTFLLTHRPKSILHYRSVDMPTDRLGGLSSLQLEEAIADWVFKESGARILFDSKEALKLLRQFGLVTESAGGHLLHALPLTKASYNLPQQRFASRLVDESRVEGYDRDTFAETEFHYEKREELKKRVGWH